MKNNRLLRTALVCVVACVPAACDLDLSNPNAPTEEFVLNSSDGVLALAVGIQATYAQAIDDYIVPPALVTDEWGTRTRSLLSYQSLFTGQNFENTYDIVSSPYNATYQVVKEANTLITAAPQVGLGPGLTAGITSLAKLFKAMALGNASLLYEQLPANIAAGGAVALPRDQVRDTVIALLESARQDIVNVPDADLAGFRSRVLGPGIDLRNTIDAMIARYALFDARYPLAIEAATRVNPAVLSQLTYPAPTTNPVYGLSVLLQYVGATTDFVASAEPGDDRADFWVITATPPVPGNPQDSLSYTLRRYATQNDAFPLYLPDEMKLIRAEAQARTGNLGAARDLINEVRTQSAAGANEPAADLPALTAADLPTLEAILAQIAYERRYELYMQGLRWEDARRLPGIPAPTFQFLPLPAGECRNNPNIGSGC